MKVRLSSKLSTDMLCDIQILFEKEYTVIGIEADSYRIVDEKQEPVLYDPEYFDVVDSTEPHFWICEQGSEGERYCYPQAWNRVGFFEDYFDGVTEVQRQFWRDYYALYVDEDVKG